MAKKKKKKVVKKSSSGGVKVTTDSSGKIISASDKSGTYKVSNGIAVGSKGSSSNYSAQNRAEMDRIQGSGGGSSSSARPTPTPAQSPAQVSSAGDPLQAIADIYSKRPDLQGLYGTDGRAINPNDPNVQGIPTILDWAEQYGAKEYSQLKGYTKIGQQPPQQPVDPNVPQEGEFPTTGDPKLDAILQQLDTQIKNAQAAGQMINPNIELTPAEVKKFLDQATSEIDPYYAEQIAAIRKNLDMSLDELQKSYELQKQQNEAEFKANLGVQQEQLADTGLAFSGARGQREKTLVEEQNRVLEDKAASASSKAASAILDTEAKIGSRNLANLQMPNLVQYEASTEGGGKLRNRRTLNFGPLGNKTGDVEYNRNRDIRSLSDYLQSKEIQRKTLNF